MAQPDLILTPFADDAAPGYVDSIPETLPPGADPQYASWSQGFPPVTMTPLAAGGIPPRGQSFNGVLKAISEHTVFLGGGGQYRWDSGYVAANGGYAIGDVIQSNDGLNSYVSLVNSNTDDFNTTPASIGVTWGLYAGRKNQDQATESVSGIAKIATQPEAEAGSENTKIMTSLRVKQSIDKLAVGRLANTQRLTTTGTVTKTPGARTWEVTLIAGGGQGGGTQALTSQVAAAGGGSAGSWAVATFDVSSISSASLVIGAGGSSGAAGADGAAGGSSTLTMGANSLTCPGGPGGKLGPATNSPPQDGGQAAAFSAAPTHVGAVSFTGTPGGGASSGFTLSLASAQSGIGGSSAFGYSRSGSASGNSVGYGSGGGGERRLTGGAVAGYFGSPGLCIIKEYF